MKKNIAVFDLCVTKYSPAGSCVLQMLKGLCKEYSFTVFSDAFENPEPDLINWVRIPLPAKPVLFRYVVFHFLAPIFYRQYCLNNEIPNIVISTQGQYTDCDISYSHFCHRSYLKNQWPSVKKTGLRPLARLATHKFNKNTEARAFKNTTTIVVPSKGLFEEVSQTYPEASSGKIKVISNPVELSSFKRPESFDCGFIRKDLGFDENDLVFVFIALGDFARKGLDFVLEGLRNLQNGSVKLLVVGGSPSEIKDYEYKVKDLGIDSSIAFVGFQDDIRPYLWTSNVFIFSSAYETFSLVAAQSAAAGLPIISTTVSGVREYLRDGENGWIIERGVDSLTNALQKAISKKPELAKMGQQACVSVEQYSSKSFINNWRIVLDEMHTESSID